MKDGKDAWRRTLATVLSQNQNITRPHEYEKKKKTHTNSQPLMYSPERKESTMATNRIEPNQTQSNAIQTERKIQKIQSKVIYSENHCNALALTELFHSAVVA